MADRSKFADRQRQSFCLRSCCAYLSSSGNEFQTFRLSIEKSRGRRPMCRVGNEVRTTSWCRFVKCRRSREANSYAGNYHIKNTWDTSASAAATELAQDARSKILIKVSSQPHCKASITSSRSKKTNAASYSYTDISFVAAGTAIKQDSRVKMQCKTWSWRTKYQVMKMRDMKMQDLKMTEFT